jgi:hypothetical protein
MTKYFKNVESLEDLKNQFKAFARKNHPDAGGDPEVMKAINGEYDQLFPIWKHKYNATAPEPTKETADSTRSEFYTAYGWKGSKYELGRSTKEVAALVRAYVKEVYPTYKFSVRYSSASMCSEIHVELKESPVDIYKAYDELTKEDKYGAGYGATLRGKLESNGFLDCSKGWTEEAFKEAALKAWAESDFYKVYNDVTSAVIADVNREVNSYKLDDCDSMIDYFHVNFYYFNCKVADDFKIVPKTTRIKNTKAKPAKASKAPVPEQVEPQALEQKSGYTYKITKGEDSRDGSELWIVRIVEKLDKAAYVTENQKMKNIGAYYSRFLHGFIFRADPTGSLETA